MSEIYRNKISISNVQDKKAKKFAFGIILQPKPRSAFFPKWIVEVFDITEEDLGFEFDCLYIDRKEDKHPCVIGILEPGTIISESEVVGEYKGTPGLEDFSAKITRLNRKIR